MAICQQPKERRTRKNRLRAQIVPAEQRSEESGLAFVSLDRRRLNRIASDIVEFPRSISDPQFNQPKTTKI
jgi:hypothetical protein